MLLILFECMIKFRSGMLENCEVTYTLDFRKAWACLSYLERFLKEFPPASVVFKDDILERICLPTLLLSLPLSVFLPKTITRRYNEFSVFNVESAVMCLMFPVVMPWDTLTRLAFLWGLEMAPCLPTARTGLEVSLGGCSIWREARVLMRSTLLAGGEDGLFWLCTDSVFPSSLPATSTSPAQLVVFASAAQCGDGGIVRPSWASAVTFQLSLNAAVRRPSLAWPVFPPSSMSIKLWMLRGVFVFDSQIASVAPCSSPSYALALMMGDGICTLSFGMVFPSTMSLCPSSALGMVLAWSVWCLLALIASVWERRSAGWRSGVSTFAVMPVPRKSPCACAGLLIPSFLCDFRQKQHKDVIDSQRPKLQQACLLRVFSSFGSARLTEHDVPRYSACNACCCWSVHHTNLFDMQVWRHHPRLNKDHHERQAAHMHAVFTLQLQLARVSWTWYVCMHVCICMYENALQLARVSWTWSH